MKWLDNNTIQVTPPKKPKKITGTRFAAILGLNPWKSPFEVWCEITRTYQEPFVETKYTKAGKAIEPKQIEYMKSGYFMTGIKTPEDVYGKDYFNKTFGDFFPDDTIFGGMWDALQYEGKKLQDVLEFKTTSRSEDWRTDVPDEYALQAALYANRLGVDSVIMVASFLEPTDYADPENFVPNINNTITVPFKISEKFPDFEAIIAQAEYWWKTHVLTGISPPYDEKKDADILKELRTNTLNPKTDMGLILKEAEELKTKLAKIEETTKPLSSRLATLTDIIKEYAIGEFRTGDKNVTLAGGKYIWNVSQSNTIRIDRKALEKDNLLEKYSNITTQYRLTTKELEED